ncbi:MAG: copper amine oxidase N-terminal domain-containing protein [Candidatus Eremiobacteraeota bacterium]|nr:copper amine oxidase N-terminal domain-containing protein [Candidatus Eremiobacteraeota bacterium]
MTQHSRGALAAIAALAIFGTCAAHARSSSPPERDIAIVVNGQRLAPKPGPRIIAGRILVPIVRILGALAIPVTRSGNVLVAQAPNETIRLTRGSRRAFIDRRQVLLDVAPQEIEGTTYVPLQLLSAAFGASANYDSRARRVQIASTLVRRVTPSQNVGSGKVRISGNLTAVDTLSEPPSLTVTYRDSVRTIAVNSSAKILLEDVVARTRQSGELSDLHVGDAVLVTINADGTVATIEDQFGSRTGAIAALSTTSIVLDNGRVLVPDKTTTITLNGGPATLGDLHVGDAVTQRMNPQTGETRQLIAVREATAAPQASSTGGPAARVSISSFGAEPLRPLHLGEKFTFTLKGTPGGRAFYDIGNFLTGMPMRESDPGVYTATFTVAIGMNFAQIPVYGHLTVAATSVTQEAVNKISVATIAPQITDIAPSNGQIVNNNKPSIYATFAAPTDLGIDPHSVSLKINGKDVTASVTRTSSFVTYTSGVPLPDGQVNVSVAVADFAGNEASRSWTFTIQTR